MSEFQHRTCCSKVPGRAREGMEVEGGGRRDVEGGGRREAESEGRREDEGKGRRKEEHTRRRCSSCPKPRH